jgi:molecular chaperone DnaJ
MAEPDLYQVLGVERRATQAEIKRAYRDIARKYHPDKNPGNDEAEQIFKTAAEAYRVLGDSDLRAQYDRYGRASHISPAPQREDEQSESASDVFQEIFGSRPRSHERGDRHRHGEHSGHSDHSSPSSHSSRPRRRSQERGADLKYRLDLDFEDAVFGVEKTIQVPRVGRCGTCGGTGARAGSAPIICQTCSGAGNVREAQGFFSVAKTCPHCGGTGKLIPESCPDCSGRGEVRAPHAVSVTVPAGVDTGTRLKLAHEGDLGPNGGPRGDLFVVVEVRPHPFFRREDDDVVTEVPVRYAQAALGATIEVPTLDGKVRMRVPPGSQPGRVFRLKGKGVPLATGRGRGDQRVRIVLEVPTEVGPELKRLLERVDEVEEQEGSVGAEFRAQMDRLYRS